jgi:hypothetical protein
VISTSEYTDKEGQRLVLSEWPGEETVRLSIYGEPSATSLKGNTAIGVDIPMTLLRQLVCEHVYHPVDLPGKRRAMLMSNPPRFPAVCFLCGQTGSVSHTHDQDCEVCDERERGL